MPKPPQPSRFHVNAAEMQTSCCPLFIFLICVREALPRPQSNTPHTCSFLYFHDRCGADRDSEATFSYYVIKEQSVART